MPNWPTAVQNTLFPLKHKEVLNENCRTQHSEHANASHKQNDKQNAHNLQENQIMHTASECLQKTHSHQVQHRRHSELQNTLTLIAVNTSLTFITDSPLTPHQRKRPLSKTSSPYAYPKTNTSFENDTLWPVSSYLTVFSIIRPPPPSLPLPLQYYRRPNWCLFRLILLSISEDIQGCHINSSCFKKANQHNPLGR